MSGNTSTHTGDSTIGAAYVTAFLSFAATAVLASFVKPEIITAVVLLPAVVAALCVGALTGRAARGYALGIGAAVGGAFPVGVWVAAHMGEAAGTMTGLLGWLFAVAIYVVAAAGVATIAGWGAHEARWLRS